MTNGCRPRRGGSIGGSLRCLESRFIEERAVDKWVSSSPLAPLVAPWRTTTAVAMSGLRSLAWDFVPFVAALTNIPDQSKETRLRQS